MLANNFKVQILVENLSPAQLKYCANDVIYLHKIHEELNKILERENRIELYQDCLKFLKTRVNLRFSII
jgi:ribonuclease D